MAAAPACPRRAHAICDTPAAAQLAIAETGGRVVVKADGLAAGKGVIVCDSAAEAQEAAVGVPGRAAVRRSPAPGC